MRHLHIFLTLYVRTDYVSRKKKEDGSVERVEGRSTYWGNWVKTLGGCLVIVTYCREDDDIVIITAVIKGK
jgi:hypothetical protein